jgi:hypothetical protein
MTIGQKISHNAKAIAALITATLTLVTAILASVPDDVIPAQGAIWISTAVGYATVAAVWLTANGPKIGDAIDTFGGEAGPIVDDLGDQFKS